MHWLSDADRIKRIMRKRWARLACYSEHDVDVLLAVERALYVRAAEAYAAGGRLFPLVLRYAT